MWWFIVTFIGGLLLGKSRWFPSSIKRRAHWFITPTLVALLCLLGYHIGGQRVILHSLPQLGLQSLASI